MLHFALAEDQEKERVRLQEDLQRYCAERQIRYDLRTFENGESLMEQYPGNLDILLLDIEMGAINGMDTARRIRAFDSRVQILFVTHLVQYAMEGYSVNAVDFIAKPVSYPALCTAMNRAVERIRLQTPRFLTTSYARETIQCQVQQISYIESLNKKTILHLTDGKGLFSSEALYVLEEKLSDSGFCRCHNAYLINLAHVRMVSSEGLVIGNETLPVSKHRKKECLQRIAAFRGALL